MTAESPPALGPESEYTDDVIGTEPIPVMFEETAERNADRDAQLFKIGAYDQTLPGLPTEGATVGSYRAITYDEMRSYVRNLAAGFRELGVERGDRVGIFADTRMEWAHCDFALLAAGGVVTTVYTDSGPQQVQYLLDDPGARGVVVGNQELLERVLAVEDQLDLEFVVSMDAIEGYDDRDDILTLGDLHDMGAAAFDLDTYREWVEGTSPDDLATLIYTSGTTGDPKGVELTHRNLRENVNQIRRRMADRPGKPEGAPTLEAGTRTISFLPLAHVFERTAGHFLMFASGATVGYAESPDTIPEDIAKIQPQTGASVPRIYERIFDRMRDTAGDSAIKSRIFEWAVDVAKQYARAENPGPILGAKHSLADRLVYSNVKETLGGNIEFMVSGGGSLSKDLAELFLGMGIPILEGYGLTETSPVVTVNPPEDVRPGTLGPPVSGMDVRIDESLVADSQFPDTAGTIGELQIDGPNVFDRYWNRPEETEQTFTEDGYFRTGDIVEQTVDGYLKFKDRIKQVLVLDTGKNVAPGPIEDRFATSDRVAQIMVLGDGQKFVSALIVPNFERLHAWAEDNNVNLPDDRSAVCRNDRVREWIDEEVERVNAELSTPAQIKQFRLTPEEWTSENDLLTPSMKKKRRSILDRFGDEVDAIYEERS